ncbi:RagB/SusD family nutrient uptake outer membrane protein [Paraflavitalea pollutisoli]|uniref:RagB/SusD family nutrient uptake outer membrane protein n=1 Tax=Paraflavitalea pollutisoli TaxID=3034143 RepID=UPI0023EC309A|nr:RagB/SusD family nutrient uptake outer membrane protein [Paraflavitalea sp. H1-2-19X]
MIRTTIKTAGTVLLLTAALGCNKIIQTEPAQSISSEIALTSSTGVSSLINSIYAAYRGLTTTNVIYPEILADNLINTINNNNTYRNQELNNHGFGTGQWTTNYSIINRANLVIDAVDSKIIKDVTEANANLYKGEALFLRAWSYLLLATSFSYQPGKEINDWKLGVPLILKPTKNVEDVTYPARNTNVEVYTQIKKDLTDAIALLNNTARAEKAYASKAAAQALLNRVHLYLNEWDAVITTGNDVLATTSINGKTTRVETTGANLISGWRTHKDKPESIFEITFTTAENLGGSSLQSWFTIYPKPVNSTCSGNPTRASFADLTIPTALLDLYEATDIRKTTLIEGPYCKLGQSGLYFSNKYSGTGGTFGLDNVTIIRTSEILLNRAEAYARKNQLDKAAADINIIRTRAGINAYSEVGQTQQQVIDAVLLQRRLELAFEGHRWYDLLRLQQDVIKPAGGLATGNVLYNDYRILSSIPAADIDVNRDLKQNPGY